MQPLRLWPKILQPLVVWCLRDPSRLRAYIRDADAIVLAEIRRRSTESQEREFPDAIDWSQEIAKGERYNPGMSQLILGTVAIHTTSDLITQTVYDIMGNPDLIDDLRKEIVTVIREGGWKKTSLYNLKLMDSVLKESQRLKPNQIAPGEKPKVSKFGFTFEADAEVKVFIRRREEEIELSAKVAEN